MIKIGHVKEVAGITLHQEVVDIVLSAVSILGDAYGQNRGVNGGDEDY